MMEHVIMLYIQHQVAKFVIVELVLIYQIPQESGDVQENVGNKYKNSYHNVVSF